MPITAQALVLAHSLTEHTWCEFAFRQKKRDQFAYRPDTGEVNASKAAIQLPDATTWGLEGKNPSRRGGVVYTITITTNVL